MDGYLNLSNRYVREGTGIIIDALSIQETSLVFKWKLDFPTLPDALFLSFHISLSAAVLQGKKNNIIRTLMFTHKRWGGEATTPVIFKYDQTMCIYITNAE